MRSKTIICAVSLLLAPAYLLYLAVLPTEIIGVHQYENSSRIVVKNFPLTKKGKIKWWIKNKEKLKKTYGIPVPYKEDGNFTVSFWDIGDGYRANTWTDQDSDLLCFNDMKSQANCIEKKRLIRISRYSGPWFGGVVIDYTIDNEIYRQHGESGEIKRVKKEE